MRKTHENCHSGVNGTVSEFRLSGYWIPQAAKLAKKVKNNCVVCLHLDLHPMTQVMCGIPRGRGKRVWGTVIINKNSWPIHCNAVMDYSSKEVIKMLCGCLTLRGWPSEISSDRVSHLKGALRGIGED